MSMHQWVRVRDDRTGHHITVTAAAAAANPHYKRINSRATLRDGSPRPPKTLQRATPVAAEEQAPSTPADTTTGDEPATTNNAPQEES